jgi:hypothetical protein
MERRNSSEARPRWVIGWLVCFSIILLLWLRLFYHEGWRWLFWKSRVERNLAHKMIHLDSCLVLNCFTPLCSFPLYLSFYVNEFNFACWKLSRAHNMNAICQRTKISQEIKVTVAYLLEQCLANLGVTGFIQSNKRKFPQ